MDDITNPGVLLAIIAGVQLLLLTIAQEWLSTRKTRSEAEQKRLDRAEDYRRQDEVAARVTTAANQAANAADLLVKATADTNRRTEEVAKLAAESDQRIREQLIAIDEQGKKIHILVNSDMTAARTAERDSMHLLIIALRQTQALTKNLGIDDDGLAEAEIARVQKRIAELDQILADRHAAQKAIDAERADTMKDRRVDVLGTRLLSKIEDNTAKTAASVEAISQSQAVPEKEKET